MGGFFIGGIVNIETVTIGRIKPAAYNPRKDLQPGDPEYEKLKKSIVEFDMVEPLVWNKRTGNLVGGHQRLKILKEMGIKSIEVSVVDLSEVKEKALNLALNKISGEWDLPGLKDLLQELDTGDFDMEITGFDDKEIEDLINQLYIPGEGLTGGDAIPEATESICRRGELWSLGKHRLLCGDATIKKDVDKLMGGEKADMVFTDPPYGIDLDTDWSKAKSKLRFYQEKGCKGQGNKYDKVIGDCTEFDPSLIIAYFNSVNEIFLWGGDYYSKRLDGGSWFVWDKRSNDGTDIDKVSQSDKMYGSCFELCWSRNRHKREIARVKWAGIFGTETEPDKDKSRKHPTQKPVLLSQWFLDKFSKVNDLIIDIYGGSGSTLIACEKLDRRCYMMEIDTHYCDVIIKRWQEFTGKEAVKIDG